MKRFKDEHNCGTNGGQVSLRLNKREMEKIGPGYWYLIHRKAVSLSFDEFQEFIEDLIETIPCEQCRVHASHYLSRYPPSRYEDEYTSDGEFIGNLIWSIRFHNTVNRRLGKPQMTISRGLTTYLKPQECEECKVR